MSLISPIPWNKGIINSSGPLQYRVLDKIYVKTPQKINKLTIHLILTNQAPFYKKHVSFKNN